MANHKSAAKRARQNIKRRGFSKTYMSRVRTAIKCFRQNMSDGKAEESMKAFKEAQSYLDKAATKGLIHRNNAARKISRLSALLVSK